jgi:hypothetical protein
MKNKKEITHPELVQMLAKPGDEIISSLTPERAHLWHMATGLIGEAMEVYLHIIRNGVVAEDKEVLGELGDCAFFIEGFVSVMRVHGEEDGYGIINRNHSDVQNSRRELVLKSAHLFLAYVTELHNLVKKVATYNTDISPELVEKISASLNGCRTFLHDLACLFDFSMDEVKEANIKKLYTGEDARYAEGYSDEAAKQREDMVGVDDPDADPNKA